MKRIFLSFALALAAFTASAETYNYLTVGTSGGEQSFTLSAVKRLTFQDGNLVVTTAGDTDSHIALDILQYLTFASSPATRVKSLNAPSNALPMAIYNMNGQIIRQLDTTREKGSLNLSGLPQGVYIVKQGAETRKVLVR